MRHETHGVYVYDRIFTEPDHRRKWLGGALVQTCYDARQHPTGTELLVATEDGRALYSALGWETLSHYSIASIVFGKAGIRRDITLRCR